MKTPTRLLFLLPIVTLAVAGVGSAQSKPLTTSEVSELIARGDPADHARLSAHFTALAERQAADVKIHTAMRQAYANSGKPSGIGMVNHCKALVGRAQESGASLRELSAYHSNLAGGASIAS